MRQGENSFFFDKMINKLGNRVESAASKARFWVGRPFLATVLVAALLACTTIANVAHAVPITVPTALSPGDEYRLAFVTTDSRDATSTGIGDYNAFVSGVAEAVTELDDLGTTWTAIASTTSVDARVNTGTLPSFGGGSLGVPIYRLDNQLFAADYDSLWSGDLEKSLRIAETGSARAETSVWTGTLPSGFRILSTVLGTSFPFFGINNRSDGNWIRAGASISQGTELPMYALSGVLSVSPANVPEPGTLILFGVGLAGLAAVRRRHRQQRIVT